MIGNLNYEEINNQGIIVSDGEIRENPRLVALIQSLYAQAKKVNAV